MTCLSLASLIAGTLSSHEKKPLFSNHCYACSQCALLSLHSSGFTFLMELVSKVGGFYLYVYVVLTGEGHIRAELLPGSEDVRSQA